MKIALIQLNASADKAKNIQRAKTMVEQAAAQGAQWVLLPEVFSFRGDLRHPENFRLAAETIPGTTTQIFEHLARHNNIHLLLGSMLESKDPQKAYNTSVAIDRSAGITAKYRKINLFEAIVDDKIVSESQFLSPGEGGQVVRVDEFTVGLSVCYDLRFPALYQSYAKQGVNVLTVPSCFTRTTGQAHWETLARARAIENLCYVLAPNQVGYDARGIQAYGHSMVINPWGEILACGSLEDEEIIFANISLDKVTEARRKLPGIIK